MVPSSFNTHHPPSSSSSSSSSSSTIINSHINPLNLYPPMETHPISSNGSSPVPPNLLPPPSDSNGTSLEFTSPKTLGGLGFWPQESNNEDHCQVSLEAGIPDELTRKDETEGLIGHHHHRYPVNGEHFQSTEKQQQQEAGGEEEEEEEEEEEKEEEDKSSALSLSLLESGPTGVACLGAGLSNLGNTCFMNAILQCFTHTVPLLKALSASTHPIPCGSKEFCFLCSLCEHVQLSLASSGKIISPVKFFDNLNNISSFFRQYQQEDAHEFLQCFLDRLERCSLDSNSIEKGSSFHVNNLVQQIFGGRLVSKLLCSHCGHCSEKFEPLIDMSLEIEEANTLESALESFTKVEKIEDPEVKFTCENCKEEVSMEKQLMLDQAPLVAALHLKRFKSDGLSVEKISKHVKFPLELDMKPYTNGHHDDSVEVKYQLYAFVVHNGFSPTSGHYFCYVRSSPDTWHKFDDSLVINVEEAFVISQSAYILFYAREGTPWFTSFIGSQKLCLDFGIPSTSPKSVLDNADGECTLYPGVDSKDTVKLEIGRESAESNITDFWDEIKHEFQTTGNMRDIERVPICSASGQNGINLGYDESEVDIRVVDSSALIGGSDYSKEMQSVKLSSPPSTEKYNQNQGTDNTPIGRDNSLRPLTPSTSLRADPDCGDLSEARYKLPKHHLKAENRVNSKGLWNKSAMDSEKEEAFRYMNKNMPSERRLTLMAAILPQNDKKRKSRSSPCKKAKSPGSRQKLMHSVGFSR